ncbi:alpha/beta fold hydrolase [Rhodoferax saidenbachensis]|uniref:Alpha/beta hydrolase n=1 Tax=Rhodoferax saidenbachensis TaxID=1484693 RepID=A0A1P8KFS3_9BURK|nr:alpha/beta hydrolase [Rhodoferax saidenbachensis]APW44825.1 alpha/beta hydrolase [Rhodoferax saidenbachensis]
MIEGANDVQSGRLLVYFHGVPGAPQEANVFDAPAQAHGLQVLCIDRFAMDSALRGDAYYQALAAHITSVAQGQVVDFVGFSMGAFIALQTSRFLPSQVRSIHLVSAAAPLDGGDFLEALAGKHVFRLAQKAPWLFGLLTRWQGVLARFAPGALFGMLFASAQGGDVALAKDAAFQAVVKSALQSAFGGGQAGYRRDVETYVQPWAASLATIHAPVHLWHGDADNWSSPAMAHYLQATLPHVAGLQLMPGLSHYSCLLAALPKICTQVAA